MGIGSINCSLLDKDPLEKSANFSVIVGVVVVTVDVTVDVTVAVTVDVTVDVFILLL